jgi:hypothetical protein
MMKAYIRMLRGRYYVFEGLPENHIKNALDGKWMMNDFYTRRMAERHLKTNGLEIVLRSRNKNLEVADSALPYINKGGST